MDDLILDDTRMGGEPEGFVDLTQYLDGANNEPSPEPVLDVFVEESADPFDIAAAAGVTRTVGGGHWRDGKSLKKDWMRARRTGQAPDPYILPDFRVESNRCPHCRAFQWPEETRSQPGKDYWHCCSDGKVPSNLQTPESDDVAIDALPDGPEKDEGRVLAARVKRELHDLFYQTERDPRGRVVRTKASREFQELIVAYTNVLSFCSESAKVDHKHSAFSTFRCMGGIRHLIGALFPNPGDLTKFCQIYHHDASQEQLERRLSEDTGGNGLEGDTLRMLQRLMRDINPYAQAFRSCGERIQENPNPQTKVHLKQMDPRRLAAGTHNKPTPDEVAAVIIMPENQDGDQPIERDILVQNVDGGLSSSACIKTGFCVGFVVLHDMMHIATLLDIEYESMTTISLIVTPMRTPR